MSNLHGQGISAPPVLLTISGFDPSCGAGVGADLKTFAAYGCYGMAAITSLTVQSTQGVEAVHNTPSAELREQLDILARDCDIAAVKIGMLGNRGNAVAVGEFLDAHKFAHVVHDPVMKSSSGTELLDAGGIKYIVGELLKKSSVITPNVPEAEVLTGLTIKDVADMEAAARKLVEMGAQAVIVKGGHMEKAVDVLFDGKDMHQLGGDRVEDREHARNGMHVRVGDNGAACGGKISAGGDNAGQGVCDEGDRKGISGGQGQNPAGSFLPHED